MFSNVLFLVLIAVALFGSGVARAAVPDPTGLWLIENKRAAIRIDRCGDSLCGKVAWLVKGGMQTDYENPDPAMRKRPMCGLPLLWGFVNNPGNLKVWDQGRIYRADTGDTYHATITVKDARTLGLRGYVGLPLFGVTQTWTRASAKDYPPCK